MDSLHVSQLLLNILCDYDNLVLPLEVCQVLVANEQDDMVSCSFRASDVGLPLQPYYEEVLFMFNIYFNIIRYQLEFVNGLKLVHHLYFSLTLKDLKRFIILMSLF